MRLLNIYLTLCTVLGCITLDLHWQRERIKMEFWRSRQQIQTAIAKAQSALALSSKHVSDLVLACTSAINNIEAELVLFNILTVDYIDPANPLVKR